MSFSHPDHMQVDRDAVKIVRLAMTKWIILGAIVAVLWIAWKWLPVGKVHGRKITPSDLTDSNVRLQLQMSRAESALSVCNKLPPRDRLPKLLETEKRFGDVFIAGDHIRQAIVATGVGEAVPHFRRILNGHHGAGSVFQGVSGALAGHIEDDYRVQTFKFLVDGLKGKDMFGSSSERLNPRAVARAGRSVGCAHFEGNLRAGTGSLSFPPNFR